MKLWRKVLASVTEIVAVVMEFDLAMVDCRWIGYMPMYTHTYLRGVLRG